MAKENEDKLLPGRIQKSFRVFGETTKPGQAEWWGRVKPGREVKQSRGLDQAGEQPGLEGRQGAQLGQSQAVTAILTQALQTTFIPKRFGTQ